jgi:hypothetical protein
MHVPKTRKSTSYILASLNITLGSEQFITAPPKTYRTTHPLYPTGYRQTKQALSLSVRSKEIITAVSNSPALRIGYRASSLSYLYPTGILPLHPHMNRPFPKPPNRPSTNCSTQEAQITLHSIPNPVGSNEAP